MVTLSACQTGFGKLQKGEGMLSLARAFNYAGVPSIVTTLWKINDQSTSEIMKFFYKNLSDGLSKKEALRQAKLSYLNANDDALLRHPYYWSGIVMTGNTMPLKTTNYVFWAISILVGFLFIWLINKKLFKLIKFIQINYSSNRNAYTSILKLMLFFLIFLKNFYLNTTIKKGLSAYV